MGGATLQRPLHAATFVHMWAFQVLNVDCRLLFTSNGPASPMQEEGIAVIEPLADLDHLTPELKETLLCFVLVGPGSQHAFCSR